MGLAHPTPPLSIRVLALLMPPPYCDKILYIEFEHCDKILYIEFGGGWLNACNARIYWDCNELKFYIVNSNSLYRICNKKTKGEKSCG